MTDSGKLWARIRDSGYRLPFLATRCGIGPSTLRHKIDNRSDFRAGEIRVLSELLHLDTAEKAQIFFANEVDKMSTYKEKRRHTP